MEHFGMSRVGEVHEITPADNQYFLKLLGAKMMLLYGIIWPTTQQM